MPLGLVHLPLSVPGSLPYYYLLLINFFIVSRLSASANTWSSHVIFTRPPSASLRAALRACVLSRFSHVQLCATPWTVAPWALLSMGFSRREYWSGLPCSPPGDHPDRIKDVLLASFYTWADRLREVNLAVWGHRASKWHSWHSTLCFWRSG